MPYHAIPPGTTLAQSVFHLYLHFFPHTMTAVSVTLFSAARKEKNGKKNHSDEYMTTEKVCIDVVRIIVCSVRIEKSSIIQHTCQKELGYRTHYKESDRMVSEGIAYS